VSNLSDRLDETAAMLERTARLLDEI